MKDAAPDRLPQGSPEAGWGGEVAPFPREKTLPHMRYGYLPLLRALGQNEFRQGGVEANGSQGGDAQGHGRDVP